MFLKRLSMKGFKSFADPTTLEFEPGVTVVVAVSALVAFAEWKERINLILGLITVAIGSSGRYWS
jgi:hypothetical protein